MLGDGPPAKRRVQIRRSRPNVPKTLPSDAVRANKERREAAEGHDHRIGLKPAMGRDDAGDMSALHVEPADDAAVGEANTEGCGFGGKRTGYLKQSPVSSFGVSSQPTIFSRTCFNAGSTRMQPSGSSTS
jgi:hypothetical protein